MNTPVDEAFNTVREVLAIADTLAWRWGRFDEANRLIGQAEGLMQLAMVAAGEDLKRTRQEDEP